MVREKIPGKFEHEGKFPEHFNQSLLMLSFSHRRISENMCKYLDAYFKTIQCSF